MSPAILKVLAIALGTFLGMRAAEALADWRERRRQPFPRPTTAEYLRAYQKEAERVLKTSGF